MCTSKSCMWIRASDIFSDVLVSDEEDNCHKEETSTESQYFSGDDEVGDILDDLYIDNGNSASDIHTDNDSGLDGHQDFSNNNESVKGFSIESGKLQGILGHSVLISQISRSTRIQLAGAEERL